MSGRILLGDVRQTLREIPADSVQCCVTSPPYWGLRDYGCAGQLGSEATPDEFVRTMVAVFAEVRRTLHPTGTLFLNIGDSYSSGGRKAFDTKSPNIRQNHVAERQSMPSGLKPKDMVGIPWLLAFALRADGWYLRSEIIWAKKSPMPSSVKDRPTTAHESIFLLSKSPRYYWDQVGSAEAAVRGTPGNRTHKGAKKYAAGDRHHRLAVGLTNVTAVETRNMRSVWSLAAEPYKGAHVACYPSELVRRCLSAGVGERGCCPVCRTPWVRQVQRERIATRPGDDSKVTALARPAGWATRGKHSAAAYNTPETHAKTIGNRDPQRHISRVVTLGWLPACGCDAEAPLAAIPCTVLDPFLGSGTTAQVAEHLGHAWLGCELNPDYIAQAEARIATVPRCLRPKPTTRPTAKSGKSLAQRRLFS